ncbi:MAG: hypothetical protein JOZ72_12995 [Alphaproteobacteria bacterium]|nr:hypothetical protein [Alphaproteobacteria bacterium]
MGRRVRCDVAAAILFAAVVLSAPARAGDDDDLARIPKQTDQSEDTANLARDLDATGRVYLQDDLFFAADRSNLAVPLGPGPSWEERLFLDTRLTWSLGSDVSFTYSGRFNLRAEDGIDFPSHENLRNDLREAYLAWQIAPDDFVEAGRINLKSGTGLGYNPTDFFKTRAVVEPVSADPGVLREDRLGTAMVMGQHLWDGGSVTVAYAPKLYDDTPIYFNSDLPSFDPMFDRTNARERILVKSSLRLADDLMPEFLFYDEAGNTRFGINISRSFGRSIVGYAEWAGGSRASLVHDALTYGVETGTLPAAALSVIPESGAKSFRSDYVVGASYTTENRITINLEYDRHGEGFTGQDWRNWFDTGIAGRSNPLVTGTLWYIRGYAQDQLELTGRDVVFLRADWTDAFVKDLNLSGFVLDDVRDGSALAQVSADYYLSRSWTVGGLVDANFGSRRSEFGSLPNTAEVFLKLTAYL